MTIELLQNHYRAGEMGQVKFVQKRGRVNFIFHKPFSSLCPPCLLLGSAAAKTAVVAVVFIGQPSAQSVAPSSRLLRHPAVPPVHFIRQLLQSSGGEWKNGKESRQFIPLLCPQICCVDSPTGFILVVAVRRLVLWRNVDLASQAAALNTN